MALTYMANYRFYLFSIGVSIAYLIGWLDWFFAFSLETFPLLSLRNIAAIGLFYVTIQMYKNQVDY